MEARFLITYDGLDLARYVYHSQNDSCRSTDHRGRPASDSKVYEINQK